jgi:hypothetical protein
VTARTRRAAERPEHVHPTRMRHIARADLLAGLGHPGVDVAAIRRLIAERADAHPPVWDPADEARAIAGTPAADTALAAAEALLRREVVFVSPAPGRSGLYALHYLLWLRPLVIGHRLTGDDRYVAGFGRHFDAWYESRDHVVGDWPGLDVVWYSLGVWARASVLVPALACFARSPGLRDETATAMLATLLGGARWAAQEHDAYRPGNWQLVCAGELLHVAALLADAPEAPDWVTTGRTRLTEHLDRDFSADGGHHERSPGYHVLCMEALHRAAAVARRDHGFALTDHPTFAATHDWLAAMTTPGGWVPAWQDSTTVWPADLLARGDALLGRAPSRQGGTDSVHLSGSGYVVLRGPAPANAYFGLNTGPYVEHELESHSHLAVTDFVVSAWGAPLAIEAGGPPSYDDPAYQQWYRDPAAHNMVTVDGHACDPDRRVCVDGVDLSGPVKAVAVHHHGYHRWVSRRVVYTSVEPGYWLICDRVDGGHPATWSILGPTPWERHGNGFRSTGRPLLAVVPADDLPVSFDEGPGQVPAAGEAPFRTLHALRLHAAAGRFDVLLAASPEPTAEPWWIRRTGTDWRISDGRFVDCLRAGHWERRTRSGDLVAAADWRVPHAPRCEGHP